MKCKHLNADVVVHYESVQNYSVKNGRLFDQGNSHEGPEEMMCVVSCYDCGMKKNYRDKYPKWLKELLDQANWKRCIRCEKLIKGPLHYSSLTFTGPYCEKCHKEMKVM